MGYDDLLGSLAGGLWSWQTAGRATSSVGTLTVHDLCDLLDSHEEPWILDVRSEGELARDGVIEDAHHIHVTQLPLHLDEIPRDRRVHIFCGSGLRSMMAASLLKREGWGNVTVVLGGLAAWHSHTCPIQLVEERIV
jgi:hydroxyacylglutathione hydrolase